MVIARWFTLTCFALGGMSPRLVNAQSPDHPPVSVAQLHPAFWGSIQLGSGRVASTSSSGLAGVAKVNLSLGPVVLAFRNSDVDPLWSRVDGVRDNGLLGGVRTGGRRLFGSAALGFANASRYRVPCDGCRTAVDPSEDAMTYDISAHANLRVFGLAASFSGIASPSRVRYSAFTVGLEAGWFGR
jgi:hypothetical protein